ncbi:MAG TPA: hypothetical protein VFZ91_10445 [Allosphingosinicella sp.]
MSYLNPLRLHFAGQFQSNVSTVNNDAAHYDNAAFLPQYQDMEGAHMRPPNGWFNPEGDAAFRLLGCTINSAWTPDGAVPSSDPVLGYIIADSDGSVPGKLVDLDPEQQLVSQIWGLQVRIADADGNTLMQSDFEPAAFMDIWDRATGSGGGDTNAGAMYQSVLTNLQWGDVSASPFLTKLQQAAATGLLSIKFNVDGINMDFTSPDFMCGRITGTIGPATATEPQHLVIGRQFMATADPNANANFFIPLGGLNFCVAVVDTDTNTLYVDLGNALSTNIPGGTVNNLGDLTVSVYDPITTPINPAGTMIPLGTIPAGGTGGYADPSWYPTTAGVAALPISPDLMTLVSFRTLAISGNSGIVIAEAPSGAFLRADSYVYRMSPNGTESIPVYAMRYGQPLSGASVSFVLDPSQLQSQQTPDQWPFVGAAPNVAQPTSAISFNGSAQTDGNGIALLNVTAGDPGTARWFNNGSNYGIDGQVYGIRAAFADPSLQDGPVNQWNFISLLLWSGYTPANPVTWTDVQPIFQQYGNLYPVMLRFLNLASYDDVKANAGLLSLAFSLDVTDPNSMPVTRDLSPAKRAAILTWLQNPLPGAVPAAAAPRDVAAVAPQAPPGAVGPRGGKAAAASRRLVLQSN